MLGGDQSKQKKFDLVSCKTSLSIYFKTTRGPHAACETEFGLVCLNSNLTETLTQI